MMRSPTVKMNLSRTVLNVDGRIYDAGKVVYNSKEVTLKCCLIAGSMTAFWICYDALLHALIQAYVLTMLTALFYGEVSEHPEPEPRKKAKAAPGRT